MMNTPQGFQLFESATGHPSSEAINKAPWLHHAFFEAISDDGRMALVSFDGSVSERTFVEVASGQRRRSVTIVDNQYTLVFASDSRHLLTWHTDGTALVWDPYLLPIKTGFLTPEEARNYWHELAGNDAERAFRAICRLIAAPKSTVAFLAEQLKRDNVADVRIQRWIVELDSDIFIQRENAQRQLARLGAEVVDELREALKTTPSLEAKRRLERLLRILPAIDLKSLQRARALEVLERISTPEAAAVLKELAGAAPSSRLTREARDSLARLMRAN
jgi:hypothetical protein